MKTTFAFTLFSLLLGLYALSMSAQTITVNCENTTGSELGVTVVLKSPAGKSHSFRCDKLVSKTFACELNEVGEYSFTVIFRENGGRKPVIPFGTCKFIVTGAESSVKAEASCGLADMVVPCESLNMPAQVSSDSIVKTGEEYSNRRHGSLLVRKFYPQSAAANLNVTDNISEKTSSWNISVISIAE